MDKLAEKQMIIENATSQHVAGFRAWVVIFSAATFCFYQFILLNMFNVLNEPLLKEFHITASTLGQISSMYFYANIFLLIPAGILIDRYSTRKIFLFAMFLSVLSTFIFGLASTPLVIMIARLLTGLSGAFSFLGVIRLATQWFPPRKIGFVIGLVVSFTVVGGIISQTPLALLIDNIGWRYTVEFFGVCGLLMLMLIYMNVQDSPKGFLDINTKKDHITFIQLLEMLKCALKDKQNWLVGICISLLNLPIFLLGALWGTLYLTQGLGLSRAHSTYITTMIYVGMIFGAPFIGWFSDRIGLRKLPLIICASFSLVLIFLLINIQTWSLAGLMSLFFALGFFVSAQIIGYPIIAESNSPKLIATTESIATTMVFVGGLTQILFAKVLESQWDHKISGGIPIYSLHDFNRALSIILIAFVITVLFAFLIRETHCKMRNNNES